MITFYPRDVGMWRVLFDFTASDKPSMAFDSKSSFTNWLQANTHVRLDDATFPLEFGELEDHPGWSKQRRPVRQCLLIGWIVE